MNSKKQWSKEYEILLRREAYAQNEAMNCTISSVPGLREAVNVQPATVKQEKLRKKLIEGIRNIACQLEYLQVQLVAAERSNGPAVNLEAVVEAVTGIEADLNSLKQQQTQAYDELLDEELTLTRDVVTAQDRLLTCPSSAEKPGAAVSQNKRPQSAPHARPVSGNSKSGRQVLPEVLKCDEFEELYGDTGGWEPEEHTEFMRILSGCKQDYCRAVDICCERAVGFTRQEIIAHARWHQELLQLQQLKREAIAVWRQKKEAVRAADDLLATLHKDQQKFSREDEAKAAEEAAWRRRQKEELERWKQHKAEQAAQEFDIQQAAERQKRREQKRLWEEKQRKREELARAKSSRRVKSRAPVELPPSAPQLCIADQQRLKQRNDKLLQRRLEMVKSQSQAVEMQRQLVQAAAQKISTRFLVPDDPERIFQLTEAARKRQEQAEQEDWGGASRGGNFILKVPQKATPAWCAGVRQ